MHPEDIKAELRKKGSTYVSLARELDVDPCTISGVVRTDRRSRPIEKAIALKIGRPLSEVFPDRYPLDPPCSDP